MFVVYYVDKAWRGLVLHNAYFSTLVSSNVRDKEMTGLRVKSRNNLTFQIAIRSLKFNCPQRRWTHQQQQLIYIYSHFSINM